MTGAVARSGGAAKTETLLLARGLTGKLHKWPRQLQEPQPPAAVLLHRSGVDFTESAGCRCNKPELATTRTKWLGGRTCVQASTQPAVFARSHELDNHLFDPFKRGALQSRRLGTAWRFCACGFVVTCLAHPDMYTTLPCNTARGTTELQKRAQPDKRPPQTVHNSQHADTHTVGRLIS